MREEKHTPGPWLVEDYSDDPGSACFMIVPPDYYGTVAKVQSKADARLISATPELLEALGRCLEILDLPAVADAAKGSGLVPTRQAARAALAKAGAA